MEENHGPARLCACGTAAVKGNFCRRCIYDRKNARARAERRGLPSPTPTRRTFEPGAKCAECGKPLIALTDRDKYGLLMHAGCGKVYRQRQQAVYRERRKRRNAPVAPMATAEETALTAYVPIGRWEDLREDARRLNDPARVRAVDAILARRCA